MSNKNEKNYNLGDHTLLRNRGFYFEDYETSRYKYKDKSKFSGIKLSLNRVSFIFFTFVFGSKIIYLALTKKDNHYTNKSTSTNFFNRQDILDRNNNLLARNVKLYSAAINPEFIADEKKLLINLMILQGVTEKIKII